MIKKKSEEAIGELPETIEDITESPILKPLLDYNKASSMLEREDESESGYLEEKMKLLKESLDTGIYDNSQIAKTYSGVLEVYKRLLFIFSRYTAMADIKMGEVRDIVEKYYLTKKQFEEKIIFIKKEIDEEQGKNKDLLKRNKELKEEIKELSKKPKKKEEKKYDDEFVDEEKKEKAFGEGGVKFEPVKYEEKEELNLTEEEEKERLKGILDEE